MVQEEEKNEWLQHGMLVRFQVRESAGQFLRVSISPVVCEGGSSCYTKKISKLWKALWLSTH